ncbi:hypothetical protein BH20PSE1_BH20PSE1_02880 [soil metagenome]
MHLPVKSAGQKAVLVVGLLSKKLMPIPTRVSGSILDLGRYLQRGQAQNNAETDRCVDYSGNPRSARDAAIQR